MLKKVLVGAGALAAVMAMASPAHAAFYVTISDGTNTVTVNDGGIGDTNGAAGVISLGGGATVGAFTIDGDISKSNSPGTAAAGTLSSNVTVSYSTTTAQNLTVTVFADGYTMPGAPVELMTLQSSLGGSSVLITPGAGSSLPGVTFSSTADGGSGPSSTPTQVCNGITTGGLTTDCSAASNATAFFNRTAPTYSLSNTITLFTGANGSSADTLNISGTTAATVPEPGSMLLLGTGLFGVARVARRRFASR